MSLNPFSARNLRPEVELMYLLRMRTRYRQNVAENGVTRPK